MSNKTEDNEESGNAEEIDGRRIGVCSHDDIKSNNVQHNSNDKFEDSDDVTKRAIIAEMRTLRVEIHERFDDFQGTLELATVGVRPATAIDIDEYCIDSVDHHSVPRVYDTSSTPDNADISSTEDPNGESSSSADIAGDSNNNMQVTSEQLLPSALNRNNDDMSSDVSLQKAHDHSSTQLRDSDPRAVSGNGMGSALPSPSYQHLEGKRDEEEGRDSSEAVQRSDL